MGTSDIPLKVPENFNTHQIRLFLDSHIVPGWNEVDAVALVDSSGNTQWAIKASASSTYAQRSGSSASSPAQVAVAVEMVRPFSQLATPINEITRGQSKVESRAAPAG